ncbi:hypothetical protein EDB84DRAFT_1442887 [Lactarius hengduanensis]|nr:hypothetical protein EDB84DRAFT_1442887 [Lactarius hengduanensis]
MYAALVAGWGSAPSVSIWVREDVIHGSQFLAHAYSRSERLSSCPHQPHLPSSGLTADLLRSADKSWGSTSVRDKICSHRQLLNNRHASRRRAPVSRLAQRTSPTMPHYLCIQNPSVLACNSVRHTSLLRCTSASGVVTCLQGVWPPDRLPGGSRVISCKAIGCLSHLAEALTERGRRHASRARVGTTAFSFSGANLAPSMPVGVRSRGTSHVPYGVAIVVMSAPMEGHPAIVLPSLQLPTPVLVQSVESHRTRSARYPHQALFASRVERTDGSSRVKTGWRRHVHNR